ncbi:MAG: caspase family protein [Thermoanaerobaculia bacterium]
MDKALEVIDKYLPAPLGQSLALTVIGFIIVFYLKRYRAVGDAAQDKTFLTLTVIVFAIGLIRLIYSEPGVNTLSHPTLIVPWFQNDDGNIVHAAIIAQLEEALQASGDSVVVPQRGYIADSAAARRLMNDTGAAAVIFGGQVVPDGDAMLYCFRILLRKSGLVKTCPMLPIKIPQAKIDDIVAGIRGDARLPEIPKRADDQVVASRLDFIERDLKLLRAKIDGSEGRSAQLHPHTDSGPTISYGKLYAVLIGINEYTSQRLAYSVSDAHRLGEALENDFGFATTYILNKEATEKGIISTIQGLPLKSDDLLIIYFSGMGTAVKDGSSKVLTLYPADWDGNSARGISILSLKERIERLPAHHKLLILDTCNGVAGLTISSADYAEKTSGPTFQVLAGTSNEEFAMESSSAGGGVFTSALLKGLKELPIGEKVLTSTLVEHIKETMSKGEPGLKQHPILVNVTGNGGILLQKSGRRVGVSG